jgi:hypothetical protein
MNKGKYKRKRERARQRAQGQTQKAAFAENVVVRAESQTKHPETADSERDGDKEHPVSFSEFFKRPSVTDWCIMVFTGVLAGAAIYQFVLLGGQLAIMRTDQRAWLEFGTTPDIAGTDAASVQLTAGQPITYHMFVPNSGKTPAKNADVTVFMEMVDADKGPSLDQVDNPTRAHVHIISGIIFPGSKHNQDIVRPSDQGTPRPTTKDEVEAFQNHKTYFAVYGIITYDDVFRAHHWTKFCNWVAVSPGTFNAHTCTQFNSVDEN